MPIRISKTAPRGGIPRYTSLILFSALLLGGCATLPSSGPTGAQIRSAATRPQDGVQFQIVELTDFSTLPRELEPPPAFRQNYAPPPTDLIGPGDVLDISIYEAGVALFGGSSAASAATSAGFDPSAQVERLPPIRVDDEGDIRLPYAGTLRAAGFTVPQLEATIRESLRGMSQNPQILVSIREAITNSIIIGGEVARPGRLVLPTNRETLSDAIALAGGYRGEAKDIAVRVLRGDTQVEFRLSDVLNGAAQNQRVFPGDRISAVRLPQTFSVMGAPNRVEQIPFSSGRTSLAEAIALAGGANPNMGDPKAIFIFRFVRDDGQVETPVVYHLNMMNAGSYFLSQRFAMRDKDVLYVGNASANQPSKLIQIISQLFAPIVTVQNIANSNN